MAGREPGIDPQHGAKAGANERGSETDDERHRKLHGDEQPPKAGRARGVGRGRSAKPAGAAFERCDRCQPGDESGHEGDGGAEQRDGTVEPDVMDTRQLHGRNESIEQQAREGEAADCGGERKQTALECDLAQEAHPSGAERLAQCEVAPSRRQLANPEARGIRAGDDQHQQGAGKADADRRGPGAQHLPRQRHHAKPAPPVRVGILTRRGSPQWRRADPGPDRAAHRAAA